MSLLLVFAASYTRKLIDAVVNEDHKATDILLRGASLKTSTSVARELRNGRPEVAVGVGARAWGAVKITAAELDAEPTVCTPSSAARGVSSPKVQIMTPQRKGSPGTFVSHSQASPWWQTESPAPSSSPDGATATTPPYKAGSAARQRLPFGLGHKPMRTQPSTNLSPSRSVWDGDKTASAPAGIRTSRPGTCKTDPTQLCRERRRLAW